MGDCLFPSSYIVNTKCDSFFSKVSIFKESPEDNLRLILTCNHIGQSDIKD